MFQSLFRSSTPNLRQFRKPRTPETALELCCKTPSPSINFLPLLIKIFPWLLHLAQQPHFFVSFPPRTTPFLLCYSYVSFSAFFLSPPFLSIALGFTVPRAPANGCSPISSLFLSLRSTPPTLYKPCSSYPERQEGAVAPSPQSLVSVARSFRKS